MSTNLEGRLILCPLCKTKLKVPKEDPKRTFQKPDLLLAIARSQLTDWDRSYARLAFQEKIVKEPDLWKAIPSVLIANRKGEKRGIDDELKAHGWISREEDQRIRTRLKGMKGIEPGAETMECPNCFATISVKVGHCHFCGQETGDSIRFRICPACKSREPIQNKICGACHANLITGLRAGSNYCPACGREVEGNPVRCPSCKAPLREDIKQKKLHEELEKKSFWLRAYGVRIGIAAAVVLLLLLCLSFNFLRTTLRALSVGKAQASLEERLRDFSHALQENEASLLQPFLASDREMPAAGNDDLLFFILTGRKGEDLVKKIAPPRIERLTIDEKAGKAEVQALTQYRLAAKNPTEVTTPDAMLRYGTLQQGSVVWIWTLRNGTWFYTAPLPHP